MTDFEKYIQRYKDLIPTEDWINYLKVVGDETENLFIKFNGGAENFSYAPGKWSLKILLQHLIDAEKIFCYRALRFSRGDKTELPGWDEELYAQHKNVQNYSLAELIEEFRSQRKISYLFFKNLSEESLSQTGFANGNIVSVETIGKLVTGHNKHHLNVIHERYLPKIQF